jgi:glycosyltransferase involved in cell wall biosynthesis
VRILQVNAFHYLRGGVERAYFDEARALTAAGHDVAQLAIQDARNTPSPTAAYFAPPADFGEDAPWTRRLAGAGRLIWSREAAAAASRVVAAFRPDVAHVHAPSRYLTPSVLRSLEGARVPTVMTLHDFKPWCTNRVMFARGAPCERCRGGHHWHAAAIGCVQGSRLRGAAAALEAYVHDRLGAYRSVRLWVAPSRFVADKVAEHGLSPASIRVLAHGVEPLDRRPAGAAPASVVAAHPVSSGARPPADPFVLYAGRLSAEKGVALLPALAAGLAPTPVVVAGEGPLREWLAARRAANPNLLLPGHLDAASLAEHLRHAAAVVIPSLFYETFCYAAAEALALARPVVASRIGAVPELIEHEVTGLLVTPDDPRAWLEATRRALADPAATQWGLTGRERVRARCDPARHLEGLLAVYREAMSR